MTIHQLIGNIRTLWRLEVNMFDHLKVTLLLTSCGNIHRRGYNKLSLLMAKFFFQQLAMSVAYNVHRGRLIRRYYYHIDIWSIGYLLYRLIQMTQTLKRLYTLFRISCRRLVSRKRQLLTDRLQRLTLKIDKRTVNRRKACVDD
jgi:hypothetical protein